MFKKSIAEKKWFYLGAILLIVIYLPILIKNQNMLVLIHDEYDGEMLTYIMQARHLFDNTLPELFNGTLKASMTPPAPGFVLTYIFFDPEMAFWINYVIIALVAYSGMYFCVRAFIGKEWISIIAGLSFSMLPFYSVYGLSVMGQPMLLYAFYLLWNKKSRLIPFCLIGIFGFCSSLVLIGYGIILLLVVFWVSAAFRKRNNTFFALGLIELTGIYCFCNLGLIKSVLGLDGGFVSHKTEYYDAGVEEFIETFWNMFVNGAYHAASVHRRIIPVSAAVLVIMLLAIKRFGDEEKNRIIQLAGLLGSALVIAAFFAVWHWMPVKTLINRVGGIWIQFQIDRFYWLYPCIWFLIYAYTIYFIWLLARRHRSFQCMLIALFVVFNTQLLWENSTININRKAVADPHYRNGAYASVNEFFQTDMFNDIRQQIGEEQDSYRVISVGLYPSIALYNGYYCLDGYSNNYNIEYKHAFRKIIAEELKKNEEMRSYFDEWGNRCYAFSAEVGMTYYVDKNEKIVIDDLDYDYTRLKRMGCKYVFSAVKINNPFLKLIDRHTTDSSVYEVYVYRLK